MAKHMGALGRAGIVLPVIGIGVALIWSTDHVITKVVVSVSLAVLAAVVIGWPEALKSLPIKSVGFGGVSVEVAEAAKATGEESEEDLALKRVSLTGLSGQWLQIRWALEMKFAYLAKHTLPDHLPLIDPSASQRGGARPYLTIGSLWYDGLLQEADAETATSLMALSHADLALVPRSELEALLDRAASLAKRLRVRVFTELVIAWFAKRDWKVATTDGENRVFEHPSGARMEVAVVFGKPKGKLAVSRVKRLMTGGAGDVVVVVPIWPGVSKPAGLPSGDGPPVIRFDQLEEFVDALLAAGQAS